ncbi:unnamed protein product [Tenebrio molitor]|nr:unnamed protein product [Tenebrio molitor]
MLLIDLIVCRYRAIKIICNRVCHESEIVSGYLNKKHRLDLGISIEKTFGFKSMDDSIQITLIALYLN